MVFSWFRGKDGKKKSSSQRPKSPASGATKGVSLVRLLGEDLVLFSKNGRKKEELIDELVRTLCERKSMGDPKPFLQKILDREQGISTTLDTGLAVPHARMDNLSGIAAILALVPGGLPDPKQQDLSIRAMFLFFSPNQQEYFTQHLHLLRGVSSLFQPEFIDELQSVSTGAEVLKLIAAKESAV